MTQLKRMAVSCIMVNLGWIVVLLATVYVCIDNQCVVGGSAGGECVESDYIFILESLILSLFKRRESLSLLGLLSNFPFFNNLSTLSSLCIDFCTFTVVPNFSYCVIYLIFHQTLLCNSW